MPIKSQLYKITEPDPLTDYNLSGTGKKKLVVVVDSNGFDIMVKELLSKMMQAIHYDLSADVYLIVINNTTHISLNSIIDKWDNLILFGISPDRVGININYQSYSVLPMDNKRVLFADDLKTIGADAVKKQRLWSVFQTMFLKG